MSSTAIEGAAGTGRALAAIPSPQVNSIPIGPLEIHFYALCILAGVIVAVLWSERRWKAMGGEAGTILDMAVWAVILGLIGGRLYHVISDAQLYFAEGREPIRALYVWEGGLGIWGAIPMGALGVWLVARKRGLSMSKLSFAIAPTLPLAQAIGRWGNYFNQELFGRPTDVPWAVEIHPYPEGHLRPGMEFGVTTYHPTFLYESLWCLGLAVLLAWAGRRYESSLQGGRLFALYVMGYCAGRFWIEYLRVDPANDFFGLRLNNWTSIVVFAGALAYFIWAGRRLDAFSGSVLPHGADAGTQVFGVTGDGEVGNDGTVYSTADTGDSDLDTPGGDAGTEYHPSPERSSSEGSTENDADTGTDSGAKPE
ncbi:prolipoprotein diacylglyceryl transferase [Nocardiopsis sp. N85]|uniref:prolipoprotein diacylglyceryl transferase n=1 Tax=Nocardiopsis sp. N85 TaxID=3029400 RepID=UPI00237F19AE|nr:prolipoprotein diacylglyceryl transferase [Nocardiopsis sp. N85]MDE3720317.1 prolipoprotein diacylglyceryl transferase [Nocardiopsis sp. N85]